MIRYILYIIVIGILILTYKAGIISFPVQEISIITSDKKYNANKLNKYLDSLYGTDLLLTNIDTIQKNIISDDWISDAEVIKSFPSKITIRIIQHEPMALYNNQIISKDGILLNSSTISSKNLPIIIDKDKELMSAYDIYSLSLINLKKIDLVIKKIEIHHSLIKIYTASIVLISDRTNFEKNILRLVSLFEDLNNAYGKNITSIDMRYSNGFAIK
jgi:cell division septal protein FtsQ